MANYSYQSSNPPMSNPDQPYPNFDFNNQNFNNFPNTNQGDFQNNQWNQQSNDYVQQVPSYQGFEPQSNNQQFSYPNQEGNFNASSYNYNQQSSGKKEGYGNRQGNSNFRGAPGNNRNSGQGFNKGPRGNFGSSNEEQQDTIFVSNLPEDTTESQLEAFFGSIGLIKIDKKTRRPRIWIYKNKETGKPKGEVTITYDDYMTASSAINWFNGKEFNGKILKVEIAQRKNNFLSGNKGNFSGRGNSSRDFDKGSSHNERSSNGRDGDWVCPNPSCKNNNFAWRSSCNRCKTEKPDGESSSHSSERRSNNLPYERRGGPNSGGRGPMNNRDNGRNSYNNSRNRNGSQQGDRSFNRNNGGNRDQRGGGRNGNQSGGRPSGGGPMRSSDSRRSGPY